jgi:plasmid stabilization system protein ParE
MNVRVTDDAKADLREIKAFISERNAIAAGGVIDRIRKMLTPISAPADTSH